MNKNIRFVAYAAILGLALYAYFQPRPDLRPPSPQESAPPVEQAAETPPAPPPAPPEEPIPRSDPLDLRRDAVQERFEAAPFRLAFNYDTDAEGRSRMRGESTDGTAKLTLIGPPEALTGVSLRADMSDANRLAQLKNANALVNLAQIALPGWGEATAWVTENIPRVLATGRAMTVVEGNVVNMAARPPSKILTLVITGPQS